MIIENTSSLKYQYFFNTRVGTADDFLKPQLFPIKWCCWKEELFRFPTQKFLARSVKERQSYRSSKSSGFENRLSPSPCMGKSRFEGTERLFDPDNDSFAYIPTSRCRRSTKADLLLSKFSVRIRKFMRTVHWPCLLCSDTRRRSYVLKDNDWHDVNRNFEMGSGPGDVQLFGQLHWSWCLVSGD